MIATPESPVRPRGSFRDPAGTLFREGDRILRWIDPSHVDEARAFLSSAVARSALDRDELVRSEWIADPDGANVLEHERIAFPSYPYEWPAEMLHAAGDLTLRLASSALEDGFGLKDATPYNVLFRGARPVFVDVLSFERRDSLDSAWLAYAQFVRTFLLPLLAWKEFGLPTHQTLLSQRDGLEPETLYKWAGPFKRLAPSFLSLVTLPRLLGGGRGGGGRGEAGVSYSRRADSPEQARFVLERLIDSCRRQLDSVAPRTTADSTWSEYLDHKSLYSPEQFAQKENFVREALDLVHPGSVLDAGANEGHFSLLAESSGASTVAIDFDPVVVGSLWRKAAGRDILPLVVDLTRPTPAMGWRNQECASFLDRARGAFDLVVMLALAHHVLVTERIPVDQFLEQAAELSRGHVLIEFVGAGDPMFQRIVRGRGPLYAHMTREWFENAALARFEIVRSRRIEGLDRWMYLFRNGQPRNEKVAP